jgi:hypothetical protein
MEVPGLPESEEEDDVDFPIPVKKNTKVTFSTGPIKVSETPEIFLLATMSRLALGPIQSSIHWVSIPHLLLG